MHLTYRNDSDIHSAASPDCREAGPPANEIEITPEMIEAGFKVLLESGIAGEHPLEAYKLWVVDIFQAMYLARHRL